MDLAIPLMESTLVTNQLQIKHGIDMITRTGKKKIGFLGFSFKAGTDDLRESPLVEVIERLIGKGYELSLYDHNVNMARLTGANREYILNTIPHINRLMVDNIQEIIKQAEVIVIGNNAPEFKSVVGSLRPEQIVIDLIRIGEIESAHLNYDGLCW